MEMKNILNRMLNHEELTRDETKNIILGITQSEFPEEQITALLTGLQMRGVTVDELLGFRDGILETGVPAILNCDRYIDVVGTGGDRKNTFNISTTSCFVIAGAGYKVAKHGNFAATSVSGASNVIKNHGVQFTDDLDKLNRSLDEAGIVYLHAQLFAKAMKFVGSIRKALQFPTVFNLLGPLVNPSQPKCQLLGVANLDQMRLYNQVYQKIGIDYGIVNSIDGYDEISLTSDFKVTTNNYERIFKPEDLGFEIAKPEEVRGGATEQEAKDIFDAVLENRALPAQKNIVLANAAFGIQVMEKGKKSIDECVEIARESIDSGKALATFKKFVELKMDILEEIIAHKRIEIEQRKRFIQPRQMITLTEQKMQEDEGCVPGGSMKEALMKSETGIIAEFKRKSPSKGWIKEEGKASIIPLSYQQNGATALSILTDIDYFGGYDEFIQEARHVGVTLPILYKNFVVDEYQLLQARYCGASAVLLIAACLSKEECRNLMRMAHQLGLEVLLEMHGERDFEYAELEPDMYGINNRNLGTFVTDVENSFRLSEMLPKDVCRVSESGISQPQTVLRLREEGRFRGFLMGEQFMKQAEPGEALAQFINQLKS